ncbi:MAG: hypothetical protein IPO08_22955 [Xanthomonadales bacterium]|nr:hypothetical protein [Xanthomonadales bacterium]
MIEPVSKSMVYGGATATIFGWFTVTEWAAVCGAVFAGIGLMLQLFAFLQRRANSNAERYRADEEHRVNMQILHAKLDQLTKV